MTTNNKFISSIFIISLSFLVPVIQLHAMDGAGKQKTDQSFPPGPGTAPAQAETSGAGTSDSAQTPPQVNATGTAKGKGQPIFVEKAHVEGTGPLAMSVEGGTHNYENVTHVHSQEGPDFTDGDKNTNIKGRMKNAVKHGFLSGIAQLTAAMVTQIPVAIITNIVTSIMNKTIGSRGTTKLQEEAIVLKIQREAVEQQCSVAYTREAKAQCEQMRSQIREMLIKHAQNIQRNM